MVDHEQNSFHGINLCNKYSINNNTLVLQDYAGTSQPFTTPPGNHTVSTRMTGLNAAFASGVGNFQNTTVTYSDLRNMYTLKKFS